MTSRAERLIDLSVKLAELSSEIQVINGKMRACECPDYDNRGRNCIDRYRAEPPERDGFHESDWPDPMDDEICEDCSKTILLIRERKDLIQARGRCRAAVVLNGYGIIRGRGKS